MSEFDSPWKEALDGFLPLFLAFFFPEIHADIDWSRGYEVLDKELEQIVREAELGKRLADKLFKVWRKNGQEAWVLIHVEVQAQTDAEFAERMYIYNYRIYDRFKRPVVSLAILADENPSWRPHEFGYNLWGFRLSMVFPVVKLLDCGKNPELVEAQANPFGLIVLAHLQSRATRGNPADRCAWKVRLVKGLLDRGLTAEEIRQLFRLIDWLMDLPKVFEEQFTREIANYDKEKKMPFVDSFERRGIEKGLREGLLEGIILGFKRRFGPQGEELVPVIQAIADLDQLRSIQLALWTDKTLDEVKSLLPVQAAQGD